MMASIATSDESVIKANCLEGDKKLKIGAWTKLFLHWTKSNSDSGVYSIFRWSRFLPPIKCSVSETCTSAACGRKYL